MIAEKSSRVFERGLEILESIVAKKGGLTAAELGTLLSSHRSTIYRYLNILMKKGYVENKNNKYVLGPRVLELASLYLERLDVRNVARPFLTELAEKLHVTVHLAQLNGPEILYIDKIETHRSLPLYSRIGKKAPVYCTALGKVLLAFASPERTQKILEQVTFKPYTERTITDRELFLEELRRVRQNGYALDHGEHEEGIFCVAAPIFDFHGEAVAAVSITDSLRNGEKNEKMYIKEVVHTARCVSDGLGNTRTKRR